jgi:hypothetical protein
MWSALALKETNSSNTISKREAIRVISGNDGIIMQEDNLIVMYRIFYKTGNKIFTRKKRHRVGELGANLQFFCNLSQKSSVKSIIEKSLTWCIENMR